MFRQSLASTVHDASINLIRLSFCSHRHHLTLTPLSRIARYAPYASQRQSFSSIQPPTTTMTVPKHKVCIIGSGNWGSVISKIVGTNIVALPDFDPQVRMWVFEEKVDGRNLSELINEKHENVKYLPGVKLPSNIIADPDLLSTTQNATHIIFVLPHQFIPSTTRTLTPHIASSVHAISLTKGVNFHDGDIELISDMIQRNLGVDCSVLMGANIAAEVAEERVGEEWKKVFRTKYFRVQTFRLLDDVAGVELCGALKNIVGVAAGLVDGLKYGDNTKAAIMRIGMMEMRKFAKSFYKSVKDETFFESCGVADVITTCLGGRNRGLAAAHVTTGKSFTELEAELLNGQKLQGPQTSKEVYEILKAKGCTEEYPLFTQVYRICWEGAKPESIIDNKKMG
ncbi:NAD-dependent glycerol-3-phosphate dehydrogenase C-terminus-domain-containing protein, partial [Chytridium lagenaria]